MTSEMTEEVEEAEVDVQVTGTKTQPQAAANKPNWSNGQCVLSTSSRSLLNPSFDLSLCRAGLEANGFQIPVGDMEAPLRAALDVPSVRRYMVFNSAFFHFVMAPVRSSRSPPLSYRLTSHHSPAVPPLISQGLFSGLALLTYLVKLL